MVHALLYQRQVFIISLVIGFCLAFPMTGGSQVGNPAPDFTVTDTHGEQHRLYDYLESGRIVVLDFFYTTCVPCQFYSPQVNLAFEKYGCNTDQIFFMAIDYDDTNAEVIAYDAEYGIQYPSISGTQGGGNGVVNDYNIFAFPTFYVIDSTKKIIEVIDPPTLQVFDFRFNEHGILPAECTTSTSDADSKSTVLKVYPNPLVGNGLYVKVPERNSGLYHCSIMDLTGRIYYSGETFLDGDRILTIRNAHLDQGIYLVTVSSEGDNIIHQGRFVVSR